MIRSATVAGASVGVTGQVYPAATAGLASFAVSRDTAVQKESAAAQDSAGAEVGPPAGIGQLRRLYTQMLRIRRFEETAARAYTRGKISGFLHLYIGQEAIAVGTADLIKPGDRVVTTYRDHGFAIALGC